MKTSKLIKRYDGYIFAAFFLLIYVLPLSAQNPPIMVDTSKIAYNQVSKGLALYVFPAKGQSNQQQKKDEIECYNWAKDQSGIDPLNLPKTEVPVQSGPSGGAVKGAAKGAAAGAAIGAITGDAGQGAAVGAAAGGMAGRRAGKKAQKAKNQQTQANAAASDKSTLDSFKKAFSVCIEGKGYTIK
jgi:hypothetical protein